MVLFGVNNITSRKKIWFFGPSEIDSEDYHNDRLEVDRAVARNERRSGRPEGFHDEK